MAVNTSLGLTQNFDNDIAGLMPDYMWNEITGEEDGPDLLIDAMPLAYLDASFVRWDQWQDPYGLMGQRGLDAPPPLITMPGIRVNEAQPGYYGNVTELRESEIVLEREPGTIADPLNIPDRNAYLLLNFSCMAVSRIRQTIGDLLLTGTFTNQNAAGNIVQSYTVEDYQTYSPINDGNTGPGWAANPTQARPINDMIFWRNTAQKGTSSRFNEKAVQLCNPFVLGDLFATTQIQQMYKNKYGATPVGLDNDGLNAIVMGYKLPKIVEYNYGYFPTLAAAESRSKSLFTYIIPNKSMIWLGQRPAGQKLGSFKLTRHAALAAAGDINKWPDVSVSDRSEFEWSKGLYVRTEVKTMSPVKYTTEMSFNACPIIYFGSAALGITYT